MKAVADILANLSCKRIHVIDVGCCGSGETRDFVSWMPSKEVVSIGVDPIRHESLYPFTHFLQAAVRNCEPTEASFYQYSDPSCSSLLRMRDNITHNHAERFTKWYAARVFENLVGTVQVPVVPLSKVVEDYGLQAEIIHCVKTDAQGLDFEVFLSLGKYRKRCLFFQMETVTSHSKDVTLYEGQSIYEEERPFIEAEGFKFFSATDYGELGASPESDVIYVNSNLLGELQNG